MNQLPGHVAAALSLILDSVMLPYQREDVLSEARFRWNCWSRQTGKSFTKAFRRLFRGLIRQRDQLFLSASARQSEDLMVKLRHHAKNLQTACDFEEATAGMLDGAEFKRLSLNFPNIGRGVRFIGLPATKDTSRGFSGDVMLDEFGMHKDEREVFAAMFPAVLYGEGECDIASTPPITGRRHMFYQLQFNPRWSTQIVTIEQALAQGLPMGDRSIIEEAMSDKLRYRREFMCEFIDAEGAFLPIEMICACEDDKLARHLDLAQLAGMKDLYVGVDVARRGALTVIWVFQRIGRMLISVGLLEIHDTPFRKQFEVLSSVMRMPGVSRLAIDRTGLGAQMAEDLAADFGVHRVMAMDFTHKNKELMSGQMRVKFDDRNIRIPADDAIRNDLNSVDQVISAAGNVRLVAPIEDGSHADRFWSAALAIHAASDPTGPVEAFFRSPFSERKINDLRGYGRRKAW